MSVSGIRICFILPTYNERENITVLLDRLQDAVKGTHGFHFRYLVVDDNSPDGTTAVVEAYRRTHKDVFIITGDKEGLGKALLRGMQYAVTKWNPDYLAQMDADLSHDPLMVPLFLNAVKNGAEFVIGSRYIPGGSIPDNWGLHRKIFSVIGNSIVRFGLGYPGVHDWTGGFRMFRQDFFQNAKHRMEKFRGYVFQIAFLHNAVQSGVTVFEVPIHFTDRRFGHSKIAPSQYIRDVLWYVLRSRLAGSFGKFLIVGTVGFTINTALLEVGVLYGFDPSISAAIGAECAIISNFFLNNRWTFKSKKIHGIIPKIPKLMQFNITSLGAIIIQATTIFVGTRIFGLSTYRIFYLIGVGIGLLWNYTMYSKVIWKK